MRIAPDGLPSSSIAISKVIISYAKPFMFDSNRYSLNHLSFTDALLDSVFVADSSFQRYNIIIEYCANYPRSK